MPCGGIYPIKGTWVEKYVAADRLKNDCFQCGQVEPPITHFCDEWDCYLHEGCIDAFLQTREGKIVLEHGHEVIRTWKI